VPPEQVRIFYSEPVKLEYLRVYDESGHRVDEGNTRLSGPIDDPDIDIDHEAVLIVGLEELGAGTYTVEYQIKGEDGHLVGDSYRFRVLESSNEGDAPSSTTHKAGAAAREGKAYHNHHEEPNYAEDPETSGPTLIWWLAGAVSFVCFVVLVAVGPRLGRYLRF
jgi:methionine-rich copper-binding protein CopC